MKYYVKTLITAENERDGDWQYLFFDSSEFYVLRPEFRSATFFNNQNEAADAIRQFNISCNVNFKMTIAPISHVHADEMEENRNDSTKRLG